MKPLCLAIFALASALSNPVWAEEAGVLATYHTDNCCLPPEGAFEIDVTIWEDGSLKLIRCEGYATEGPGCKTRRATVADGALDAIRAAAAASGLADKPAQEAAPEDIPMGGGSTSGSVILDGTELMLLAFPAARDVERVGSVLDAIRAAIPSKLQPFLEG